MKNPDKKILRKIQKIYRNKLNLKKFRSINCRPKDDLKKKLVGSPKKHQRKKRSQGDINISINILDSKLEGNFFNSNSNFIAKGTPTFNVKSNYSKKPNGSGGCLAEGERECGLTSDQSDVTPKKTFELLSKTKNQKHSNLFESN